MNSLTCETCVSDTAHFEDASADWGNDRREVHYHAPTPGLDLAAAERNLLEAARTSGVDFAALLAAAATHCGRDSISAYSGGLPERSLRDLVNDELAIE